jgi:hypothetical protein
MFISAFLLGNLDNTAECLVQQRQRRAQQHDEQQPGVSLGRAFGTRYLDGHRTGFTCRPHGHIETCLLAQVFPYANIDSKTLDCKFHNKRENHKNTTLEWERTTARRDQTTRRGDPFAFICFLFPYQTAAYTVCLILLFAFGRVDMRAWGGNSRRVVVVADGEKMGHVL